MPVHPHVRRAAESGSVMIELALAMSLAFPVLLGVGAIGIRLGRTLQATELTRDVAHMYAWGADFSLAGTQAVASTLRGKANSRLQNPSAMVASMVMPTAMKTE